MIKKNNRLEVHKPLLCLTCHYIFYPKLYYDKASHKPLDLQCPYNLTHHLFCKQMFADCGMSPLSTQSYINSYKIRSQTFGNIMPCSCPNLWCGLHLWFVSHKPRWTRYRRWRLKNTRISKGTFSIVYPPHFNSIKLRMNINI